MSTPAVLLLIFRRGDLVRRQIDALRHVRPGKVYVAADGPREGHPEDLAACDQARVTLSCIDWPCQIKTLFRSKNLGVKLAVSQAIDWFFRHEEEGVILEEDCLAHPDFFSFCSTLLERYRADARVMQISGTNFQPQPRTNGQSYYFSRYNHVWGWATWRRAWSRYRPQMEGLDEFLEEAARSGFWDHRREQKYWRKIFTKTRDNQVQSWAYRWSFSLWAEGGLCIYPEVNLVTNHGFGSDATNTTSTDKRKASRPLMPLKSVAHPFTVTRYRNADLWTFQHLYWGDPLPRFIHHVEKLLEILSSSLAKLWKATESMSKNHELSPWESQTPETKATNRIR